MPPLRWLVFVSLVVTLGAPQHALAAPAIQGLVEGRGMASTFQIMGGGSALEGGAADWTLVCGGCLMRVTFYDVDQFTVVQNGAVRALGPGQYELRELRGLVLITQEDLGRFHVEIHGYAKVSAL